MNAIVKINIPSETMSSLEISELTGKRHDNVLRDIDSMFAEIERDLKSEESFYRNNQNKQLRKWNLSRNDTLTLVSGYSVSLRSKIVRRWDELENKQAQPVPVSLPSPAKQALEAFEVASRILNLSESSKLKATKNAFTQNGMDYIAKSLPDYSIEGVEVSGGSNDTRPLHSITYLLKVNELKVSAQKANAKLSKSGVIIPKTRLNSKKKIVSDGWQLADDYKHLGRLSAISGTKTQLHFFADSFDQIIKVLEA